MVKAHSIHMTESIIGVTIVTDDGEMKRLEIIPIKVTSTSVTYTVRSPMCFTFKTSPGRGTFQVVARALAILAKRIYLTKK